LRKEGFDRNVTQSGLQWRCYLACRKREEQVAGPGVAELLFRFLDVWDGNTQENWAGFVVRRVDGMDVR
jgi:hypothetical protein